MQYVDGIAVFGSHDDATLGQMRRVAERAAQTVLCADAHVGYTMPVGGVAAYRDQVSVVGVGFDIACLAAGTRVATADGYHLPIERVTRRTPVTCFDGERVRRVSPLFGCVARGRRQTLRIGLANGRSLRVTDDHRVLTRDGWRAAGELRTGDAVACTPFVGLPFEAVAGALDVRLPLVHSEPLRDRGLWPVETDSAHFPALLRLLGYVNGDGHLTGDGKRVSVYTTVEEDAADIASDFRVLGVTAHVYRRARGPGRRDEFLVAAGSVRLHALFAALGAPVGRKAWTADSLRWLFDLPAWMRAQYLSAFASAEMMTPRVHANGGIPNLQLKQAGEDRNAIDLVARICRSLGFETSVAESGPRRGTRPAHVLQLLGGQAEQLRFMEQVGFCRARDKRVAAARVASVVWSRSEHVAARESAKELARSLHAEGESWRVVVDRVASQFDVPRGFVYHAIYARRGNARRLPNEAVEPDCSGDACWVRVASLAPDDVTDVYDVVTGDLAESFLADGVVVHNCGNAAIRTDVTLEDFGAKPNVARKQLERIGDAIQASISFGVGRKNRADDAPMDDPLFGDPAWGAVPPKHRQALRVKAQQQLGTVGSGNHYVDVFADESGTLWVGVHFGSRGFGHTVASAFLAVGQGKAWGDRVPEGEVLLDLASPEGHDYWHLMNLAGRYAYTGREWVARKVVSLIGGREMELVHNHHNFAWKEVHGGEELVVVRKGATPAFPGQRGFVGGSMGDDAVIVQGAARPSDAVADAQRAALFSTIHGAGRVMSRTAAAGKRNRRTGKVLSTGRITPEMMNRWLREKDVILRGGGLDEAPQAYRRLPDVIAAQEGTVEVLHVLRPLVVVMAGAEEFDPYKD